MLLHFSERSLCFGIPRNVIVAREIPHIININAGAGFAVVVDHGVLPDSVEPGSERALSIKLPDVLQCFEKDFGSNVFGSFLVVSFVVDKVIDRTDVCIIKLRKPRGISSYASLYNSRLV